MTVRAARTSRWTALDMNHFTLGGTAEACASSK